VVYGRVCFRALACGDVVRGVLQQSVTSRLYLIICSREVDAGG